jgi:hypothetical protein
MTAPVSLATATAGVFRPLVNASFRLTLPTGEKVIATLAEVREQAASHSDRRPPFSLVFHHPRDPAARLPGQGTLVFEHPASGALEAFAVPLQPQGDVARWQVVFG